MNVKPSSFHHATLVSVSDVVVSEILDRRQRIRAKITRWEAEIYCYVWNKYEWNKMFPSPLDWHPWMDRSCLSFSHRKPSTQRKHVLRSYLPTRVRSHGGGNSRTRAPDEAYRAHVDELCKERERERYVACLDRNIQTNVALHRREYRPVLLRCLEFRGKKNVLTISVSRSLPPLPPHQPPVLSWKRKKRDVISQQFASVSWF